MLRSLLIFLSSGCLAISLAQLAESHWLESSGARILTLASLTSVLGIASISALRSKRITASTGFSADRVFNKSLAIAIGWVLVTFIAHVGVHAGMTAPTIFLGDFLFLIPFLPVLIPAHVLLSERLTGANHDAHSTFGALLRGQGRWNGGEHRTLVLGWLVKAFFIPLMYGNFVMASEQLLALGALPRTDNWIVWFAAFGLAIDLLVATAGYLSTSKIFGAEIRGVDASWISWAACLICYAPFFQYVQLVTEQRDTLIWTDWLQPNEPLYWLWAFFLVTSWGVYWLSSIAFGLRFSNLTYRGLVDKGPYRYFKHPAYLFKNVYWWLFTVPFFGVHSTSDLAANLGGLTVVSLIYFLRAKTEERYLRQFPEYSAYMRRLDAASLASRVGSDLRGLLGARIHDSTR